MEMNSENEIPQSHGTINMVNGGVNGSKAKITKRKRGSTAAGAATAAALDGQPAVTTTSTGTRKKTSQFRGVTRHSKSGHFDAHLWDKTTWNDSQTRKGKQVYLGTHNEEDDAARTHDLAAIKYWGASAHTNFPMVNYTKEIESMKNMRREEFVAILRRRSSGFSRGRSKYRGVARHHKGKWEARVAGKDGKKYQYLGTYETEEDAARAYDKATIACKGINALTNFEYDNASRACHTGLNVPDSHPTPTPGHQTPQSVETYESETYKLPDLNIGLCDSFYNSDNFSQSSTLIDN